MFELVELKSFKIIEVYCRPNSSWSFLLAVRGSTGTTNELRSALFDY